MKFRYFILLLLISCKDPKLVGLSGSSESISESKRRDVFMAQYKPTQNLIIFNKNILIDEVWIEKGWRMKSFIWETNPYDSSKPYYITPYQLIIKSQDCQFKDYGHNDNWDIENGAFNKKDANGCYLITKSDSLPKTDTLTYLIKKGENSKNNNDTIGEIKLIKVQ